MRNTGGGAETICFVTEEEEDQNSRDHCNVTFDGPFKEEEDSRALIDCTDYSFTRKEDIHDLLCFDDLFKLDSMARQSISRL